MMMPVTGVGNPSRVARKPSSVPCRPAPNINTPMPRSNGHVALIEFTCACDMACRSRRSWRSYCSPGRPLGCVLPDAAENAGEVLRHVDRLDVLIREVLRLAPVEQKHVRNAIRQVVRSVVVDLRIFGGPRRIRRTDEQLRLNECD